MPKQPAKRKQDNAPLPGDPSEALAALRELKEKVLADKIELQTKITRGDLIEKTVFSAVMGSLFSIDRSQILVMDLSIGDTIASILKLPAHTVRNIIGEAQYEPVRYVKKKMENFIKKGTIKS